MQALIDSTIYDGANRMLSRTLGNGVVSSYQYNANGWLTSVQHARANRAAPVRKRT